MEHIHVACAIIERKGEVLAARRSAAMSMPLKREFPGGKIDPGESPEACLAREVREELGVEIRVGGPLTPRTHTYTVLALTVTLYPYICSILSGIISLHEHAASAWLAPAALNTLNWAEADRPVVEEYVNGINK